MSTCLIPGVADLRVGDEVTRLGDVVFPAPRTVSRAYRVPHGWMVDLDSGPSVEVPVDAVVGLVPPF